MYVIFFCYAIYEFNNWYSFRTEGWLLPKQMWDSIDFDIFPTTVINEFSCKDSVQGSACELRLLVSNFDSAHIYGLKAEKKKNLSINLPTRKSMGNPEHIRDVFDWRFALYQFLHFLLRFLPNSRTLQKYAIL